mmetsp:Transcript_16452/g.32913  ORF Transcript_16452/g.32913 Transcript_16452/m.32913 type:complete len:133 (+) Transcript_16452:176-574(+)
MHSNTRWMALAAVSVLAMTAGAEGGSLGDAAVAHSLHRAAMKHQVAVVPPSVKHSITSDKIARDDAEDKYIDLPAWALGERSRGGSFAGSMTMLAAAMLCVLIAVIAGAVLRARAMRRKDSLKAPIYADHDV